MNATATVATMDTDPATRPEEFRTVSIDDLQESKTNPRRHFAKESLAELTESIRQKGILLPLLVREMAPARPSGSRFEIVSGARRYRAAKAAGLTAVPVRVVNLTDQDAIEVQVIENLQREDVHPLDEAAGYEALMGPPFRQPVETIANRIGRSVKYIYDRVKLLKLTKEAQELFWNGDITAGHAILLARIPPDKQKLAIETALFVAERTLFDPEEDERADRPDPRKAISVRELQAWIDEHVRFDSKQADPMLFPETAQTLEAAAQQDEKVLPITYEHVVKDTVRDGSRIFGPRSWVRADGRHGSKACEHSEMGLVVAGPRRGEAFRICRDKQKCLVHYGKEIRARQKRENRRADQPADKAAERLRREQEKRQREQAEREAKRRQWKKATPKILEAVAAAVKKAPTKSTGLLGEILVEGVTPSWGARHSLYALVPRGTTPDDLIRHAAFRVLVDEATDFLALDWFPKRARAFGIDVGKILKEGAPPKSEPAQTSANPPTKEDA